MCLRYSYSVHTKMSTRQKETHHMLSLESVESDRTVRNVESCIHLRQSSSVRRRFQQGSHSLKRFGQPGIGRSHLSCQLVALCRAHQNGTRCLSVQRLGPSTDLNRSLPAGPFTSATVSLPYSVTHTKSSYAMAQSTPPNVKVRS
jgi:hypothetical protein